MRELILTVFLFSIFHTGLFSQTEPNYKVGEKLTFEAYYGWITGAKAEMELKETTYGGKQVYYAKIKGYSVGLTERLYRIRETFESYFDQETYLTIKAVEDVKEGEKYTRYLTYLFDQTEDKVWSSKSCNHKVPDNTFDVISAFYHIRNMDLSKIKKGDVITVHTFFQNEPWDLVIKYLGTETIKIGLGKISCMKFRPMVQKQGVFKDEEALNVWISADQNKIPVRAQMDLMVGAFKIDLISYQELKYTLELKK